MSKKDKEDLIVPDNAIGIEDLVRTQFYQIPKVLLWNEKYRTGTNSDGKLLYGLIKDRFESSLDKTRKQLAKGRDYLTYVDENNKIFCRVTHTEIMFDLGITLNTAKKAIKQLKEVGLIHVKPKSGGAHHLYLIKPDDTDVTFSKYMADKLWFKHMYSRENKKGLAGSGDKTYEEILEECEEKWGPSTLEEEPSTHEEPENPDNQAEEPKEEKPKRRKRTKRVSKNDTLGDTKNDTREGAKNDTPDGTKNDTPEGQNLTPNNTESNEPESNQPYPNNTDTNFVNYSSSRDETYPQDGDNLTQNDLEEEESNESIELSRNTLVTQESEYSVLKGLEMLIDEGICTTAKDFNVLCKKLKELQVPSFELWIVSKHIPIHQGRVAERESTPDAVDYEPAFFACGLADTVRKEIRRQQGLAKRAARKKARANTTEPMSLPLYNWLEEEKD